MAVWKFTQITPTNASEAAETNHYERATPDPFQFKIFELIDTITTLQQKKCSQILQRWANIMNGAHSR